MNRTPAVKIQCKTGEQPVESWWRGRPLRIYHPNAREFDFRNLDVKQFVLDCKMTNAEAIVVSAGGVYAFYPSAVPYHYVSPVIQNRDLLSEIVAESHAQGLRVIARVDFSKARENVWKAHPEWFQRRADGKVIRHGDYYRTCPVAGYQNEDFALPVLREILTRYDIDGFHLNAGGFHGYCYCDACATSFDEPVPTDPKHDPETWLRFLRWRQGVIAKHLADYYQVIRAINSEAFFMGELAGMHSLNWARSGALHLPSLSHSFSQLLLTAGNVGSARQSRWWVDMTVKQARAAWSKGTPIINVKSQMRDLNRSQSLMPLGEFAFYSYQALAQGAGLKVPTFGMPQNMLDSRFIPALAEVFGFMNQQKEVLDTMKPISSVALIWPEWALLQSYVLDGKETSGLHEEFVGLYSAMKARHVLFSLLYDEHISAEMLKRYEAVVMPTAVWLSAKQADDLVSYVLGGGRLVLFDSPAAKSERIFRPVPRVIADLVGGTWSESVGEGNYALPADQPMPSLLRNIGPVALTRPYRKIEAAGAGQVWLRISAPYIEGIPEDLGELKAGEDPIVLMVEAGKGTIVYMATGLGQMLLHTGHPDYATILDAMLHQDSLKKQYLVTDAPTSVGVTAARWKLGVVVHLINAAGPAPLDAPAPTGPIKLDLAWDGSATAHLYTPKAGPKELHCEEGMNRIKIVVPRLDSYAQILVRST